MATRKQLKAREANRAKKAAAEKAHKRKLLLAKKKREQAAAQKRAADQRASQKRAADQRAAQQRSQAKKSPPKQQPRQQQQQQQRQQPKQQQQKQQSPPPTNVNKGAGKKSAHVLAKERAAMSTKDRRAGQEASGLSMKEYKAGDFNRQAHRAGKSESMNVKDRRAAADKKGLSVKDFKAGNWGKSFQKPSFGKDKDDGGGGGNNDYYDNNYGYDDSYTDDYGDYGDYGEEDYGTEEFGEMFASSEALGGSQYDFMPNMRTSSDSAAIFGSQTWKDRTNPFRNTKELNIDFSFNPRK